MRMRSRRRPINCRPDHAASQGREQLSAGAVGEAPVVYAVPAWAQHGHRNANRRRAADIANRKLTQPQGRLRAPDRRRGGDRLASVDQNGSPHGRKRRCPGCSHRPCNSNHGSRLHPSYFHRLSHWQYLVIFSSLVPRHVNGIGLATVVLTKTPSSLLQS